MSDAPFNPSAGPGAASQEPSEEEVRAYVAQLRAAPVDQVVAEVLSALLNAAQVKLGRRDGRLLIDLVAALADAGRAQLTDELTGQVDQALTQLRMAQVQAEQQVAAAAAQGQHEPGDLGAPDAASGAGGTAQGADASGAPPAGGPAGQTPPPGQAPPPSSGSGKRLWVPGR